MACFLSTWNVNTKTDTNSRCENQTPNPYPSHSGRPCGRATIRLFLLHTQGDLSVKPLCNPPIPIPPPPHSALYSSDYASLPSLFACTAPHNTSFERQTPSKTKREKLQKTPRPQGNPKKTICALSLIRNRGGTLAPKAEQVLAGTKLSIPPAFSPFSKTAFLRPCTVDQCHSPSADHANFVQITAVRSASIQPLWSLCSSVTERCFLEHWGRLVLSCETPGPI